MTSMDYSKAKKLHPKLKVGNVKRLIAAIRKADSLEMAMAKAKKSPLKIGNHFVFMHDVELYSATDLAKSKVPLVFHMPTWMDPVAANPADWLRRPDRDMPTCGTAACIAGFAGSLMARDRSLDDKARNIIGFAICTNSGWTRILAEFLGIDEFTAERLSSAEREDRHRMSFRNENVRPRHAARLLEIFLKTGKVDWARAMGMKKVGMEFRMTVAEKAMARKDMKALEDAA